MFQIFELLKPNQKKKYFFLCILFLISMMLELIGIGVLIPLISFLQNPDQENFLSNFKILSESVKDLDKRNLIIYFFVFTTIIFMIKNLFLALVRYSQSKFTSETIFDVSKRVFFNIYDTDFLIKNNNAQSYDIINSITNEARLFGNSLIASVTIISESIVALGLICFLFIYNPVSSIFTFLFMSFFSFLFFLAFRKKHQYWGRKRKTSDENRLKYLLEGFYGIKDIKVYCKEKKFKDKLIDLNNDLIETTTNSQFFGALPKLYLEIIVLLLIFFIIFIFELGNENGELLVFLGLTLICAIRVFPASNQIILALQTINYTKPSVKSIKEYLSIPKNISYENEYDNEEKKQNLNLKLELKNLTFSYGKSKNDILKNFSQKFNSGEIIGLTGESGSGKSTLLNIILGLVELNSGQIKLNDKVIENSFLSSKFWKKKFSYVPQSVFIFDETIKYNIVLKDEKEIIDEKLFDKVILDSQLSDFIKRKKNTLETRIGGLQMKISGGERQRIGIARALYRNADIIIYDEATASLDKINEEKILNNILKKVIENKIITLCTHNKEILKNCTRVVNLNDYS